MFNNFQTMESIDINWPSTNWPSAYRAYAQWGLQLSVGGIPLCDAMEIIVQMKKGCGRKASKSISGRKVSK